MNIKKLFVRTAASLLLAANLGGCDSKADKVAACMANNNILGQVIVRDSGQVSISQRRGNQETSYVVTPSQDSDRVEQAHYLKYSNTTLMPIMVGAVPIMVPVVRTDEMRYVYDVYAPDEQKRPIFAALRNCAKQVNAYN